MTLKIKSILSLLLAFLLTFAACSAAPHKERVQPPMSERILQIAQGMKKLAGVEEGDCLLNASDEFLPVLPFATGQPWHALSAVRRIAIQPTCTRLKLM